MALGTLTSGAISDGAGSTSRTTGSFTPSASSTLIAYVCARKSADVPATPAISDSGSRSWTEISDDQYDPGANPRLRIRSWWALAGGSPVSMTVTGTCADSGQIIVGCAYITGASTDFSNSSFDTSAAGDPSVTLGSGPAASSVVMAIALMNGLNAISPASGFTEIDEVSSADGTAEVCYDATSPGTTITWSTSNTAALGQAFEIKEAAAAAAARAQFINFLRL
jgi:hypothetical protein